ncbi:alternate-type signal peptide domain-containing protein [Nocardioides carbamazepini]|uniref:alternate-type signal peptide domain-containing protein n=1 Tax=Nocardioides carbamazepini TaxID=2854259 RepID=UPI002149B838|nr:alternate-type signal peptide domain-containing protein [Nocardioides carbamazepini]MCR1783098.1 alternate-type signal peptide domain-containing protein [Nocardioides carbamazepini]
MKKTTKGALAAGTAAVLLMGGAGTLAYWSDTANIGGTSISTGSLALENDNCGGWVLDKGDVVNEAVYTNQLLVPGDSLTRVCSFQIEASGAHLEATLTTPAAVPLTGTLESVSTTESAPVNASYVVADDAAGTTNPIAVPGTITSSHDGKYLVATVTVDFPYGTQTTVNANDTQLKAGTLDAITVSLTQDDNH